MSLLGSMDKKQLPLSAKNKKPPPSFLSDAQGFSLRTALLFACVYAGLAASKLRLQPCNCQQEPEPAAAWPVRRYYVLTGADVVHASPALWRGIMWCSAPQAAAAALALALLAGGRRGLGIRAAALVALAATFASHWMYLRLLGLCRIDSPGDLYLAVDTAVVFAAAALDLPGLVAFVLGIEEVGQPGPGQQVIGDP